MEKEEGGRDRERGRVPAAARELDGAQEAEEVQRRLHARGEDLERGLGRERGGDEERREDGAGGAPREPVSDEGARGKARGAEGERESGNRRRP